MKYATRLVLWQAWSNRKAQEKTLTVFAILSYKLQRLEGEERQRTSRVGSLVTSSAPYLLQKC